MRETLRDLKLMLTVWWQCAREDASSLYHRHQTHVDHPDAPSILTNLKHRGYHVLRGYYPRERCEAIRHAMEAITVARPDCLQIDAEQSDHRIWGSERGSDL